MDGIRSYSVLILALDTTTRAGSVAVTRDDRVMAIVEGDASMTHGERLPGEIDHALAQAGVRAADIDLLVVASGPGAFTGLRIGLAATQGLSMVLGTPVVGVSALDALALASWPASPRSRDLLLFAWMDAQRGEVFSAAYRAAIAPGDFEWRQQDAPVVGEPRVILEAVGRPQNRAVIFAGDGAVRYRSDIDAWSDGAWSIVDPPRALAPALALIGRRLAAQGAAGPPHALQPLYVRRPDAELERLRRAEP